ncbi:amidohydrolase [Thalassobacillus devorans]|uniref:amidohydrolase n=1 Tax=Thalassobacillus devorans TaxID=279813 RepID=UPI000A1CCB09|nr:amidohydrolase [Thalassobacillus devorans]
MNLDLIVTNANIITLDYQNTMAKSLLVSNGKIVKVDADPIPDTHGYTVTASTEKMDLQGATLLPGFIDTHSHLLMYGELLNYIDFRYPHTTSIEQIKEKIKEATNDTPPGEWIIGWGYDDTLLAEGRHPTIFDLDDVSRDHPVFIRHISGHFAVINSKALDLAGITADTPDPYGGFFGRDESGELNGVIHEIPALEKVFRVLPVLSEQESVDSIGKAAEIYLSQGITTCTDAGVGLDKGISELHAHLAAIQSGKNPLSMRLMVLHHLLGDEGDFADYNAQELQEEISKKTNYKARLDSAKMFQDGSIQGYTGALREPYYSKPFESGGLLHEQEAFNNEVLDLHNRGFRIAIHGNGDRAIESNINAIKNAVNMVPRKDHRHRIEHVQTAAPEDLRIMKEHGIAASFFINHVYYWGERHRDIFLGPERAAHINPLADAKELDLLFTLHSDCPITPISPLFSVWAAVNRLTSKGNVLGENQKIDVLTALKSMTIYGAELNFEEDEKGTIEVGKKADFVVLEEDPLTCRPEEIKNISILNTIIDGKTVWADKCKSIV